MEHIALFAVLAVVLVVSIGIDFFGHRDGHEMSFKESSLWSLFWIAMGIGVGGFIWFDYGDVAASEYFAGYAMEKALSIDNLMVFMAIFSFFGIKDSAREHKILLWGIAGALVFRGIFVAAGSALFHLHWAVQVLFGLIVIYSAKSIFGGDDDEEVDFNQKWFVKAIKKVYPVDADTRTAKFFSRVGGRRAVTPMLLCMVTIELCDIIFSFDSVPAVIGVTKEPALIYAAMIMAVLGLRSLFFVLGSLMKHLTRLDFFVAIVLVFVGAKLIAAPFGYEVDAITSLCTVLGLLGAGVVASFAFPKRESY